MKINIKFSDCFNEAISFLEISNAKLAKILNVDPSLISKWRHGTRVPPYNSKYISLFVEYLKVIEIDYIKMEKINKILTDFNYNAKIDFYNNFEDMLLESQSNSLRENHLKKNHNKEDIVLKGSDINEPSIMSDAYKDIGSNKINYNAQSTSLISNSDNNILLGNENIICGILNLLKRASEIPCKDGKNIIMTLNNESNYSLLIDKYYNELKAYMLGCLENGWNIIILLCLNSNINRTAKFIDFIQPLITNQKIDVFFFKCNKSYLVSNELFVIPDIGYIHSLLTNDSLKFNEAITIKTKNEIALYYNYLLNMIKYLTPLATKYKDIDNLTSQKIIFEIEKQPRKRYLFENRISSLTIPLFLYEKYSNAQKKINRIEKSIEYHEKRLNNFYEQIKYYKYIDICVLDDNLFDNSSIYINDCFKYENLFIDKNDIILYMKNLLYLLQKYNNYSLIFISKNQIVNLPNINYIIKDKSSILINSHETYKNGYKKAPGLETIIHIKEKSIINAYKRYYIEMLNNIPDEYKNKENLISSLKNNINRLSK